MKPRPPTKYSFEQVEQVREMSKEGKTIAEIMKVVPMSQPYISQIKAGRIRTKR
jgi:hypothetical protein